MKLKEYMKSKRLTVLIMDRESKKSKSFVVHGVTDLDKTRTFFMDCVKHSRDVKKVLAVKRGKHRYV